MANVSKLPISLVVITMNEEENLRRCLAAASFCSEFVVVDSGSTDGTLDVAEQFGARIFHRKWNGYGEQKNFGCEQVTHPWILCIDADEVVTDELAESIRMAFASDPQVDGFDINRHGVYAGRLINHSGWYPQWRTFLYRAGAAKWGGMEPHVIVEFSGKSKSRLKGDLLHYTYRTIDEHLRKNISSARAAAIAMKTLGKRTSVIDLLLRPPWAWFRCFVMQRGFLDGFHGLVIANGQATYTFLKYAYLRELLNIRN
ncbi:MAG: glycosyltransferase family 2 protein [Calditrichaeota bacterium]|nr:glycosyltransferase family 2 protein [Calditrichota bacterium]MCB9368100.1 glycosyltransferase family 2 protein [Calditrichota bacterium]